MGWPWKKEPTFKRTRTSTTTVRKKNGDVIENTKTEVIEVHLNSQDARNLVENIFSNKEKKQQDLLPDSSEKPMKKITPL